jgi:hypothetical protein
MRVCALTPYATAFKTMQAAVPTAGIRQPANAPTVNTVDRLRLTQFHREAPAPSVLTQ